MVYFCIVITTAEIYDLLEQRRAELGLTQAEVSQRAFQQSASAPFQNIRRGSSPSVERLAALASALGLELYIGPPRDPQPTIEYDAVADEAEFVRIRRFDVDLAGGAGRYNGEAELLAPVAFRKSWLTQKGLSPEQSCIVGVRGDSMIPHLSDGDLVLLDLTQTAPVDLGVYGIVDLDGEARVKRLELVETGYLLRSDNPDFKTETRLGHDAKRIRVIGRVVSALHELEH